MGLWAGKMLSMRVSMMMRMMRMRKGPLGPGKAMPAAPQPSPSPELVQVQVVGIRGNSSCLLTVMWRVQTAMFTQQQRQQHRQKFLPAPGQGTGPVSLPLPPLPSLASATLVLPSLPAFELLAVPFTHHHHQLLLLVALVVLGPS